MCTRFVYRGNDIITGFNFDIDLSVWTHKLITEKSVSISGFCDQTELIILIMA